MKSKGYVESLKYASIGISWVLTTSVYFYLGFKGGTYLDTRLGTAPTFLLLGLLGATGLSLKTLISEIMVIIRGNPAGSAGDSDSNERDREKSNKTPQELSDFKRKGPR